MAKILHIADVHLDSPFSLLDPQKSQARRNELRGTFTSAMMYAKMEKYDIVIIAGDLFDCVNPDIAPNRGDSGKVVFHIMVAQYRNFAPVHNRRVNSSVRHMNNPVGIEPRSVFKGALHTKGEGLTADVLSELAGYIVIAV